MEDDLKKRKKEDDLNKNGRRTNQPKLTYLAVTPLKIHLVCTFLTFLTIFAPLCTNLLCGVLHALVNRRNFCII
jgi:hypothetical protein